MNTSFTGAQTIGPRSFFSRLAGHAPALLIICLVLWTQFGVIITGSINLAPDEAQYWDWSRHFQLSYYSKGPLVAWTIRLGTALFGNTELGVRFCAPLCAMLAMGILYLLAIRMNKDRALGVAVLVVAASSPLFLTSGIVMTTDVPLTVCWTAGFAALYWISVEPRRRAPYVLLTLALALGILAKYIMICLAVTALLWLFGLSRRGLLEKGTAVRVMACLAAGCVIGLLPIVIWNAENDWVGMRHLLALAGLVPKADSAGLSLKIRPSRVLEHLGSQAGIMTPWWLIFTLAAGWRALRNSVTGGADAFTLRRHILLAAGFWPLFLGFAIWSFFNGVYANWPAMCYVAGCLLAAEMVVDLWTRKAGLGIGGAFVRGVFFRGARRLGRIFIFVGAAAGLLLMAFPYAEPFLPKPAWYPLARFRGWDEAGRALETARLELPQPELSFVFTAEYGVAAEAAFYMPSQPTVYCVNLGRRMTQYDLWPQPGPEMEGWDAVFLGRPSRIPESVFSLFKSWDSVDMVAGRPGEPAQRFTIVTLRGFKGHWPAPVRTSF